MKAENSLPSKSALKTDATFIENQPIARLPLVLDREATPLQVEDVIPVVFDAALIESFPTVTELGDFKAVDALPGTAVTAADFAQVPPVPLPPPQDITPPAAPSETLTLPPSEPPPPLPPPEELLQPAIPTPEDSLPSEVPDTLTIEQFEFEGNTAFSDQELAGVTAKFTNRPITFAELLSARSAVTNLYVENGYVTSGALIPPQTLTGGRVTIQVVEGGLEEIQVSGTGRLNPNYVRSRLAIATEAPLNVPRLLDALRLLQLDPLIANLSAELSTGSGPGTSLLLVEVSEADSFNYQIFANNGRSPSVGSFRRGVAITEGNLFGLGDALSVSYTNTDGSNGIDASYTLPINPRNGTLAFAYGTTSSEVIEEPFTVLDVESSSHYYDLTWRQPLVQTPTQEFAVGLTASHRRSQTVYLEGLIGEALPFPAIGADAEGRTRVSTLRFFQDWTQRGERQVIALRSQFNIGIDAFDATISDTEPDSRFFSWRGQAQWVRLLAPETLLLVRGDMQWADQGLLPTEQLGLGGQSSVRGYRQDALLTDSGVFASAEVRLPILRVPQWQGVLQLTPFVDFGTAWNNGGRDQPNPNTLAAIGLGLLWQQGDTMTARLDWGIPLVDVNSPANTWQENGLYFSITISNPF